MKICRKCGFIRTSPGRCIPCKARQNAIRYLRESDKLKKYGVEYRKKNRHKMLATRRKYYDKNRTVISQKGKAYRKKNAAALSAAERKKKYGINLVDYHHLMASQLGCCAVCGKSPEKFHVDHSHVTGKVRGLLCTKCNCGIGQLQDSPILLRQAALYLENSK